MAAEIPVEPGVYAVTASFDNGPHEPLCHRCGDPVTAGGCYPGVGMCRGRRLFVFHLAGPDYSIALRQVEARSISKACRKVERLMQPGRELAGWHIARVMDLSPVPV